MLAAEKITPIEINDDCIVELSKLKISKSEIAEFFEISERSLSTYVCDHKRKRGIDFPWVRRLSSRKWYASRIEFNKWFIEGGTLFVVDEVKQTKRKGRKPKFRL